MAHPTFDEFPIERMRAQALLRDDLDRGVHDCGVPFVEDQQRRDVTGAEVALALDRVIQPQYCGRGPAAQDPAACVEPVLEGAEGVRGAPLVARQRVCPQASADDDAERAFGAHEDLIEIWSCGLPWVAPGMDERSVGQHDVEPDNDVLDLAVPGGQLACAATCQPSADGRQRHRLRPVANGQTVLPLKVGLEVIAERAGKYVDDE